MMKNAYLFILKCPLVVKIFKILYWIFGFVGKRLNKKTNVKLKICYAINLKIKKYITYIAQYLKK